MTRSAGWRGLPCASGPADSEDAARVQLDAGTRRISLELHGIGRATACVDAAVSVRLRSCFVVTAELLGHVPHPLARFITAAFRWRPRRNA